ncbi:hypothetical protein RB601_004752 [Gaeumannomyces tritici]
MVSLQPRDFSSPFNYNKPHTPPRIPFNYKLKPAACPGLSNFYPQAYWFSRLSGGDHRNMGKGSRVDVAKYIAQSPGQRQGSSLAKLAKPAGNQLQTTSPSLSQSSTKSSAKSPAKGSTKSRSSGGSSSKSNTVSGKSIREALVVNTNSPRHAIATAPLAHKGTKYDAYESGSSSDSYSEYSSGSDLDSPRSCASSSSSFSSGSARDLAERILERRKEELVDRVMARFYSFFAPWLEARFGVECYNDGGRGGGGSGGSGRPGSGSGRGGGGGGGGSLNGGGGRGGSGGGSSGGSKKRQQRDDSDDGGDDGGCGSDDEGNGGRRGNIKRLRRDSGTRKDGPRFACPFFKNDQKRYGKVKTCCGPGWEASDMHRLKEHIYRKHSAPNYLCSRCLVDFKTEKSLYDHSRAREACLVKESSPHDRKLLTKEQIKKLRAKFKSGLNALEKWRSIYAIIFPDAEIPQDPSWQHPDYEGGISAEEELGEFLDRELPRAVRQTVEAKIDKELEGGVMKDLDKLVKQAVSAVFQLWRDLKQQQPPPQPPPLAGGVAAKSSGSSRHLPSPSTESAKSLPSPDPHGLSDTDDLCDVPAADLLPEYWSQFTFDQILASGGFAHDIQPQAHVPWDSYGTSYTFP